MFDRHGVPKSRIDVLGKVPMFEGLPRKVLSRIDSHCDEVEVHPGQTLTSEGHAAREAFIVAGGRAEVRVGDEVVRQTDVGEMIGDIGVLQNRPRTATVTATTDMRLLVVNGHDLDWLFQDKQLAARVEQNLERHLAGPQPSGPTSGS
ncbi:MAG TPA: cyclic nucleotide-binding domain-containing protein [Nocardioides sp.]|uniref:Crp/Fnr family transcriptional regulator n=1 Tax=Nocardioides sp. TaxID=35761 RepID=UPI002F3E2159